MLINLAFFPDLIWLLTCFRGASLRTLAPRPRRLLHSTVCGLHQSSTMVLDKDLEYGSFLWFLDPLLAGASCYSRVLNRHHVTWCPQTTLQRCLLGAASRLSGDPVCSPTSAAHQSHSPGSMVRSQKAGSGLSSVDTDCPAHYLCDPSSLCRSLLICKMELIVVLTSQRITQTSSCMKTPRLLPEPQ